VPLQTEFRFRPRGYRQPPHWRAHGATRLQVAHRRPLRQQRQRPPLQVAKLQRQWPQGGRRYNNALAHVPHSRGEDKLSKPKSRRPGARMVVVTPSATRTSSAPPPQHQRRKPSAYRQIPTRILPDERSTNLRAEAPYRGKGRTAPEHERRPSSARRLVRSPGVRGATTALAAGGGTGSRSRPAGPASPTR
jgi:hypothetical protein